MNSIFERSVADFKALSAQVHKRERVYFEAIHSKMKTFTPQAMAVFALETAGGINVATDAPVRENNNIAVYGKERLLAHAAGIDVFLSQQGAMNQASIETIMAEPGFSAIKAVKAGRVFQVDETIVSRPHLGAAQGDIPDRLSALSGCILFSGEGNIGICRHRRLMWPRKEKITGGLHQRHRHCRHPQRGR
jgi:iron complex transport system substrate-binding protein